MPGDGMPGILLRQLFAECDKIVDDFVGSILHVADAMGSILNAVHRRSSAALRSSGGASVASGACRAWRWARTSAMIQNKPIRT